MGTEDRGLGADLGMGCSLQNGVGRSFKKKWSGMERFVDAVRAVCLRVEIQAQLLLVALSNCMFSGLRVFDHGTKV